MRTLLNLMIILMFFFFFSRKVLLVFTLSCEVLYKLMVNQKLPLVVNPPKLQIS